MLKHFSSQKIYKADGDAHSWDWLALVSPCVDVLRRLAASINEDLGARQGNKHAIPDLNKDISSLMASLQEHEVYVEKEGRVLDDDELPVPDVLSAGAASLTHGLINNPLDEFNAQFDQLRKRRGLVTVASLAQYLPDAALGTPPATQLPSNATDPQPPPFDSDSLPQSLAPSTLKPSVAATAGHEATDDVVFLDGDDFTIENLTVEHSDEDEPPDLGSPFPTPPLSDNEDEIDENLFTQSPTLTRQDPADVDLDMDDDWFLDADDSDYDGEDGEEGQLSGSESD